jgi:hypothetical protein
MSESCSVYPWPTLCNNSVLYMEHCIGYIPVTSHGGQLYQVVAAGGCRLTIRIKASKNAAKNAAMTISKGLDYIEVNIAQIRIFCFLKTGLIS